CAGYGSW
nr:immunoglobulin heavy chain junction region [Mus musculus]MBK4187763.1 immunoglobulin heavy chain junction region [Mus musculus]MBK4187764.1 immunoglobulin heavy chain junction region [Mus musculus]MBK4187766.1 immunoglobulin heavy chain junction region [Mus musculus]